MQCPLQVAGCSDSQPAAIVLKVMFLPAASDADNNSTVEKDEFASLVLHMASADLRSKVPRL